MVYLLVSILGSMTQILHLKKNHFKIFYKMTGWIFSQSNKTLEVINGLYLKGHGFHVGKK